MKRIQIAGIHSNVEIDSVFGRQKYILCQLFHEQKHPRQKYLYQLYTTQVSCETDHLCFLSYPHERSRVYDWVTVLFNMLLRFFGTVCLFELEMRVL